jgi:hypothetical protein
MKITARLYVPTQNENWTTVQWELTAYSTLKKIQKNARKIIMEIYYFYAGDFPISKIDLYDEDGRLLIDTKPFEVDLRCRSLNSPEPNYRGENSNGETEHLTLTKKRVKLKAIIQGDICKVYIAGYRHAGVRYSATSGIPHWRPVFIANWSVRCHCYYRWKL